MRCWWVVLLPVIAQCATPEFRVERAEIAGGSELLTVFGQRADRGGEIPLLCVLRDTLGDRDTETDRLRYVWVLTSTRPTVPQPAAAAVPFFYLRPRLGENDGH